MICAPCIPSPAAVICLKPSCVSASLNRSRLVTWSSTMRTLIFSAIDILVAPFFSGGCKFQYFLPDAVERKLAFNSPQFKRHAGHSIDNAGFFVLPDGAGACMPHFQKARGT